VEIQLAKEKTKNISWLPDVEEHDYTVAESYLSLLYDKKRVAEVIAGLLFSHRVRSVVLESVD
jgi:hypothetical protein